MNAEKLKAQKRGDYSVYTPGVSVGWFQPLLQRGSRRRVAHCPQRLLHTAGLFTACKAIISISTSLLAFLPTPPSISASRTAESARLHMESSSLNRDVIDLPPFVRGKCSQTSQAIFAVQPVTGGSGSKKGGKKTHQH